nr:PREDICTED: fasciclin-3 isoform X3 [Bemisia tabaci]
MWFSITCFTLLAVSSFKDAHGYHVETNTRYIEALPKDTIVYKCKIPTGLIYCRMEIPGFPEAVLLAPGKPTPGAPRAQYEGDGFDKGHCGLRLSGIEEKNNGQIKCTLGAQDYTESSQNMTLTVARAPSPPELKFLSPITSGESLREGDAVSLKCTASKGRPIANLTWFIGNDTITEGLSAPTKIKEDYDFYTISQNLTRTLQASDSGKELRCVAGHIALLPPNNQKAHTLRVQFAPKPWEKPHEQLGLVEGQEGKVEVLVQGNPKPTFTWKVGEESFYEGYPDPENKYVVMRSYNKGGDVWASVLKINNLSKEDIKKTYWLRASNVHGERDYEIYISTNTEPRFGAKTIIFLFIAIIICAVVALAVFARAKGLWCFAGDALMSGIRQIESSDTESMNHRPGEDKGKKDTKPKISVKAIFKKKWDQKPPEASKPSSNGNSNSKSDGDKEAQKPETTTVTVVSEEAPKEQKKGNDNIVYAELTLPATSSPVARPRVVEDKTEYAEIIHS